MNVIKKAIEILQRRVFLLVGRAIVTAIDNDTSAQSLKVTIFTDEVGDGIERMQNYGFDSWPAVTDTLEAVILYQNGERSQGVAVCVHDRAARPADELAAGTSIQYDNAGARFKAAGGKVAIGNKSSSAAMTSTPPVSGSNELLEILDRLLTSLQGPVDLASVASTGTNSLILAELALLQADLQNIKGVL